ncbi:MAG: glycosyltransferase [Candidatus Accumulibacter meliphilus]|jgi:rhamnopyranosyl-N-acetylglucosaminyl-diphospho-decaprenol beta-1,3/1,4-galactofuranosyltransferase|uniref:Glycosyltransferase n=1 Tax=Candidatus Accumulibacter meliphilus TaxID=2211374 RepID=A0A369XQR6_9PROT|nr:MAG: glycosyltransferase [Candidatus Accumulibacter meliphilus]
MNVLAAIVTHNRCSLLERCIDHLKAQTRAPDAILVVNNASTDGTVEMLQRRDISFVTQENVGSAGGWYRGIQHALEHGFDAVWLMDDDGFSDPSALALLADALRPGVACASSVVVREDERTRFVFPFPVLDSAGIPVIWGWPRKLPLLDDLRRVAVDGTYPFAHFFNGALISLEAVRKAGNVNRDYYIYGDEVDYFFRLRRVGSVVSVLDALHYHPDVSKRPYSPIKVYYYVKNSLVLNTRYFNVAWFRHGMVLAALLGRMASRNGLGFVASLLIGRHAYAFYSAIVRGLQGKVGKDFRA